MDILLIILIVLLLCGGGYGYTRRSDWGNGPVSIVGILLIILLIFLFFGRGRLHVSKQTSSPAFASELEVLPELARGKTSRFEGQCPRHFLRGSGMAYPRPSEREIEVAA